MSQASPSQLAHRTVLLAPATQWLVTDAAGVYVDGTFGRGGHTRAVLNALGPQGRLIALDRDPQAAQEAQSIGDARFHFEHTAFSQMQDRLAALGIAQVQGLLLDLGVSSPQIDDPQRGFSFRFDGPLDMRMDPTQGESAAQWLARASVEELTRVIRDYGEERFAAPIAKAIVARRASELVRHPLASTGDLAALVADTLARAGGKSKRNGQRYEKQHPATRTFQAIRIHINQEFEELALALTQAGSMLAPGGRLVVISFHSLEDRIVKRFIEAHAHPERADAQLARLPLRQDQLPAPRLRAIAKVMPGAEETAANPRARSAVMRVAERTDAPWPAAEAMA